MVFFFFKSNKHFNTFCEFSVKTLLCYVLDTIDEEKFLRGVKKIPMPVLQQYLTFHILPEEMKERLHKNLQEVHVWLDFYLSICGSTCIVKKYLRMNLSFFSNCSVFWKPLHYHKFKLILVFLVKLQTTLLVRVYLWAICKHNCKWLNLGMSLIPDHGPG